MAACSDDIGIGDVNQPLLEQGRVSENAEFEGLDAVFRRIGTALPAFAGAYIQKDGSLAIMLTDLQDSVEANALVRRNLAQEITVNSSVTTQEKVVAGVQPGYSRYLVSRYTFVELHNWKSAIRASLLSLDAVSAIDIDEV